MPQAEQEEATNHNENIAQVRDGQQRRVGKCRSLKSLTSIAKERVHLKHLADLRTTGQFLTVLVKCELSWPFLFSHPRILP